MRALLGWLLLAGCAPQLASREALMDPQSCAGCHPRHFAEWSGSMHAYAAQDPVFRAMNKKGQRETNGALGSFCVNCHAPMAVREGATVDGLNLDEVEPKLKGVTCYFCHSVESVDGTHDNPLREAKDLVMRGPISAPHPNGTHASGYSELHTRDQLASSALCGSCHDIVNGHGVQLERTFLEWQSSVFNRAPGGATCGQCHMAQGRGPEPVASVPDAPDRRRHSHTFAGVDVALEAFPGKEAQRAEVQSQLNSTLQMGLCVTEGLGRIRVLADNAGAGHSFPSGASQDRRLWVEVKAYRDGGVVFESGAVADGASEIVPGDANQWLVRDCLFDDAGNEVHDFWKAASTESNTLPAQVTFDVNDVRYNDSHVMRVFPRNGALAQMPDRVTARFRLRPMSLDVLDALIASGDLDPSVRDAMPTFDVGKTMEWTPARAKVVSTELGQSISCVSPSNLTLAFSFVPAPEHTRCR